MVKESIKDVENAITLISSQLNTPSTGMRVNRTAELVNLCQCLYYLEKTEESRQVQRKQQRIEDYISACDSKEEADSLKSFTQEVDRVITTMPID